MNRSIKILRNGNITIPAPWRKSLGLDEGDFVNAEMVNGNIVLKPAKIVDTEDAWFYSKEWQAKEAEVDKEISEGKTEGPFTLEELLDDLDS